MYHIYTSTSRFNDTTPFKTKVGVPAAAAESIIVVVVVVVKTHSVESGFIVLSIFLAVTRNTVTHHKWK